MQLFKFLSVVLGASLPLAAANSHKVIANALEAVTVENNGLYDALLAWNGELMDSLDISEHTQTVLETTQNVTVKVREESPIVGDFWAIWLIGPTKELIKSVDKTMGALESIKDKFEAANLVNMVKMNLVTQKEASTVLSGVIVEKMGDGLVAPGYAKQSGEKIAKILDRAIGHFSSSNGTKF